MNENGSPSGDSRNSPSSLYGSKYFYLLVGLIALNAVLFFGISNSKQHVSRESADKAAQDFLEQSAPKVSEFLSPMVSEDSAAQARVSIREMFRELSEAEGVSMPSEAELQQLELEDSLSWKRDSRSS